MIYTGIDSNASSYFEHYGVKGMKWGQRKQIPLVGRIRRPAAARPIANRFRSNNSRISSPVKSSQSSQKAKIARHQKIKKAVAIGVGIVGAAAVTYGAYKLSKYASTPQGKAAIKNGLDFIKNKTARGVQRARLARQGISRTVSNIPGTRTIAKAYVAASLVSDVNSAQQFARHVHKNGKITGKDLKNFAIDIAMPIPDNIPGITKNKYDKTKRW